jgi:hypothetical protein
MTFMVLAAALLAVGFMSVHDPCLFTYSSLCLLTMCALILSTFGVGFLLTANPLLITVPASRGVSIVFRLDRPPRF